MSGNGIGREGVAWLIMAVSARGGFPGRVDDIEFLEFALKAHCNHRPRQEDVVEGESTRDPANC